MIALAALLSQGTPTGSALAGHPEGDLARALMQGFRPRRLAAPATLLRWSAEATGTADFLVDACLAASGDRTEVAALLLPTATGTPPGLGECLATLDRLASLPEDARASEFLALASRLQGPARLLLMRLAGGTFRQQLKPDQPASGGPRRFCALLVMIAPQGPQASFALRHGNGLVPIARLPLALPETPAILAWARAHVTDRFGPNLAVIPDLVFELSCEGTIPNGRRKSGIDLVEPRLHAWLAAASPDQASTLEAFLNP